MIEVYSGEPERSIEILETATGRTVGAVPVEDDYRVAELHGSPDGERLYILRYMNNSVEVVETSTYR